MLGPNIRSCRLSQKEYRVQVRVCVLLFLCLTYVPAFADGWTFINGRFPDGKVTVFKLTKAQKAYLDLVRRCHKDNTKTPFLFRLTRKQSITLEREVGFSPDRFAVFESYRGDKGVDIEVNVINRFSKGEFEVPHKLLTRRVEARNWEVNTIGWLSNPLVKANPSDIRLGRCPQ
jgi:hypothetical protein